MDDGRRSMVPPRIAGSLLVAVVLVLAAGCGLAGPGVSRSTSPATTSPTPTATPTSSPTPTASPGRTPTAAQIVAVAQRTYPRDASGAYGTCDAGGGFSACPFTPRLVARLTALAPGVPADLVCRCQNISTTFAATGVPSASGGVAHVVMFSGSSRIDLTMVLSGGRLLVDDISCSSRPGTSTYAAGVPGPCGS